MQRRHLIEISDEAWCPRAIRHAVTDYCRFVTEASGVYNAVAPMLVEALQRTGASRVLDLGSGAAGPWLRLQPLLSKMGLDITVCLSDHNPDVEAFERSCRLAQQAITYYPKPVDATQVPSTLHGFRTLFSAFHHLRPAEARAALANAVAKGEGLAVFECAERSILALLLVLPTPLRVLLATPCIRPFRWSRLFWTYQIPVVPLVALFDGLVSCLRTYGIQEMRELTEALDAKDYPWEIGELKSTVGPIPITYLIGVPNEDSAPPPGPASI